MYWVKAIVLLNEEPNVLIGYYHLNPISKIIEIHTKVSKNEDEFKIHYERVKSL